MGVHVIHLDLWRRKCLKFDSQGRTPSCGHDSAASCGTTAAAAAAAVRGETAGILEKSHKVIKIGKYYKFKGIYL